ncbi:MAG: DEAD/DEAH box helicase [Flavobacteriales bacterium]
MEHPFMDLGLSEDIVAAVVDLGFEKPSEIQEKAIPLLLEEQSDIVALAQTGTGKTAAFSLPLLERIKPSDAHVQALILSPTRELAIQIARDIQDYSKYLKRIKVATVYGGANIFEQSKAIKRGAQIVVATPGRLKDMINRRFISLEHIETCILDEADEMLNMGFKDDLDEILSYCPDERSTWLFSATMPREVARIAKNYMQNPIEITCGTKNQGASSVTHQYSIVKPFNRYAALKRLIDFEPDMFGIVFCRTRHETQDVAERLIADGYNAGALHGDLSQNQRDVVMGHFRKKHIHFLVATDVAARGIDVNNVTHVINYQLPEDVEAYTHRSGRTGRAGNTGISYAIITPKDKGKIRRIEGIIKKKFEPTDLPSAKDVADKKLISIAAKWKDLEINDELAENFLPYFNEVFEDVSKEDILKRLITKEMEKFLSKVKNENINHSGKDGDRERGGRRDQKRYFINLGENHGFDWMSMKDYIREQTGLGQDDLQRVDVMNKFAFFTVHQSHSDLILERVHGQNYDGTTVNIEETKQDRRHGKGGGGGGRRRNDSGGGRRRSGGGGGGDWSGKRRSLGSRRDNPQSRERRGRRHS